MSQPEVSRLLRESRLRSGKSLRSVADDLGVAASHLSRLERGQAASSPALSARAASYYGLSEELVGLASGQVPSDIIEILRSHPEAMERLRADYGAADHAETRDAH